jgi:hypothetical protein
MLPVSGAEQLKTSEAKPTRPIISERGAYSRLLRPAPHALSGRKRFQRPSFLALAFSSSTTGTTIQRLPFRVASSICAT